MSMEDQLSQLIDANPDVLLHWIRNESDSELRKKIYEALCQVDEQSDDGGHCEWHPEQQRVSESKILPEFTFRPIGALRRSDSGEDTDDDTASCCSPSIVPRQGRKSVTSDLFHQWLTSSAPRSGGGGALISNAAAVSSEAEDQNERLIELILDISKELDINALCHKILVNVGYLTKADRCSLFLARGPRGKRYLEAKLFDVGPNTTLEEALDHARRERILIPFGVGICGNVAQTKDTIYLKDAYEDARFNREIDEKTGYRTQSLVCMPVCNYDGEVIAVAQIINKRANSSSNEFNENDLKVFSRYLTFCGIGLQNAQLFEVSILEYKKNQLLLSLARNLFQEQMSLERLVTTIIIEAKSLLNCERCTVYLLDLKMYDVVNNPQTFMELVGPSNGSTAEPEPQTSEVAVLGGSAFSQELGKVKKSKLKATDLVKMVNEEQQSSPCSPVPMGGLQENVDILNQAESVFQRVWELSEDSDQVCAYGASDRDVFKSRRARIAKYVAITGEVLNLSSVANWLGETIEDKEGIIPKTMLCLPIFNGQRDVIGVAQLINKKDGTAFNESDIILFEAFAIFCGIGIHNTKMYEGACKLMAKQKVALDCLSYHATATDNDTETLAKAVIPPADKYQLYSFQFIDADLSDEETLKVTVRMFMEFDLVSEFQIPYKVLCRWILSVKKNYRPVKYHNWRHALNVCQTMFTLLKTGKLDRFMTDLETFGLLVACLCHDLDHRGTNNAFESKSESPLALLYSTSTMEHHHFDQCVMILNSEGNNLFQGLSTEDYRKVMTVVEQAILATDLALYFRRKDLFLETANKGEIDWQDEDKKQLLCAMLMTASDVSAIAKPWDIQHKLAKRVADEFFDQGDLEKLRLNMQPIAMMDRERKDELPKMQVEFIDVVCRPLYNSLSESFPWIKPLLDGCMANREKWADLAEKVAMGLTWIDHDTIEKPIEEITVGTGEAKDIEFTVETLRCSNEAAKGGGSECSRKSGGELKASLDEDNLALRGLFQRSFRSAKGGPAGRGGGGGGLQHPHHHHHPHGHKGGSFFHRRLSAKSPSPAPGAKSGEGVSDERRSSTSLHSEPPHSDSPMNV